MIEKRQAICNQCENLIIKNNEQACALCGCLIKNIIAKESQLDETGIAFRIIENTKDYICRAKKW